MAMVLGYGLMAAGGLVLLGWGLVACLAGAWDPGLWFMALGAVLWLLLALLLKSQRDRLNM